MNFRRALMAKMSQHNATKTPDKAVEKLTQRTELNVSPSNPVQVGGQEIKVSVNHRSMQLMDVRKRNLSMGVSPFVSKQGLNDGSNTERQPNAAKKFLDLISFLKKSSPQNSSETLETVTGDMLVSKFAKAISKYEKQQIDWDLQINSARKLRHPSDPRASLLQSEQKPKHFD